MEIEDGWHTYWTNPGESGLPVSMEAQLPDGWKMSDIYFPTPIRFMTGELAGFGYEGVVYMPVDLIPPVGFKGNLPPINATLKWLTCNDESCLPGKAQLNLIVGDHSELINETYAKLPKPILDAVLTLSDSDKSILITLKLPADSKIDPISFEILPTLADIIDPKSKLFFLKHTTLDSTWTSSAPKSEYLSESPKELEILLKNTSGEAYVVSTQAP
jgi:DsbC/DsbD-like thiol-disulfide interchange protein